jgi:hypothetical protein
VTTHPAALPPADLLAQCDETRSRGSGPGGQHRNKVETRVVLVHRPTGIRGEAGERRAQGQNRSMALFRLRLNLATQVRLPPAPDGPSPLWRGRVRAGRVPCNPHHEDFPSLLAEALDQLARDGWRPPEAAGRLGCSGTQLVRFVAQHPAAFALLNRARAEAGLRPLR